MRIIYSRGFPYGAPLFMLRGGATKDKDVKAYLKHVGFQWNGVRFAWEHYMYADDAREVLVILRDQFKCEILPKKDLDPNYVIELDTDSGRS